MIREVMRDALKELNVQIYLRPGIRSYCWGSWSAQRRSELCSLEQKSRRRLPGDWFHWWGRLDLARTLHWWALAKNKPYSSPRTTTSVACYEHRSQRVSDWNILLMMSLMFNWEDRLCFRDDSLLVTGCEDGSLFAFCPKRLALRHKYKSMKNTVNTSKLRVSCEVYLNVFCVFRTWRGCKRR